MIARTTTLALGTFFALTTLAFAPRSRTVDLPAVRLGPYGSALGTNFKLSCREGFVVTGFKARADSSLATIGPICRFVGPDGQLDPKFGSPGIAGSTDGSLQVEHCPAGSVAAGFVVYRTARDVVGLKLVCRDWKPVSRRFDSAVTATPSIGVDAVSSGITTAGGLCADDRQPITAMLGRAGTVVHSLGVTCDEP